MTINWSEYERYIAPSVSGCSMFIVRQAVADSAIELCQKSLIWRETLSPVTTVIGDSSYTLTLPSQTRSVLPINVQYNKSDVNFRSEEDEDYLNEGWRNNDNGTPSACRMSKPDVLDFDIPSISVIANGIVVRMAIKPTRASTGGDNLLFEDWAEVISNGAKGRLLSIPKKSWSDPKMADFFRKEFLSGVQVARSRASRGHTKHKLRVKLRDWV